MLSSFSDSSCEHQWEREWHCQGGHRWRWSSIQLCCLRQCWCILSEVFQTCWAELGNTGCIPRLGRSSSLSPSGRQTSWECSCILHWRCRKPKQTSRIHSNSAIKHEFMMRENNQSSTEWIYHFGLILEDHYNQWCGWSVTKSNDYLPPEQMSEPGCWDHRPRDTLDTDIVCPSSAPLSCSWSAHQRHSSPASRPQQSRSSSASEICLGHHLMWDDWPGNTEECWLPRHWTLMKAARFELFCYESTRCQRRAECLLWIYFCLLFFAFVSWDAELLFSEDDIKLQICKTILKVKTVLYLPPAPGCLQINFYCCMD